MDGEERSGGDERQKSPETEKRRCEEISRSEAGESKQSRTEEKWMHRGRRGGTKDETEGQKRTKRRLGRAERRRSTEGLGPAKQLTADQNQASNQGMDL